MKDTVEDKLVQFLKTCLEPFTIPVALKGMDEPVTARTVGDLVSFLRYHHLAFSCSPDIDEFEGEWLSRAGLFTGKPVVLRMTPTETAGGYMIPGSRLVPFVNPALLPHELSFTFRGNPLERFLAEVGPDDVYPLYQLFGEEYAYQYLSLDNPENEEVFADPDDDFPETFSLSVVDMKGVYWDAGYKPGDMIVARVVDWDSGAVDLDVFPAADIDSALRAQWMTAFEESLATSFEQHGAGASIDEQLAYAWFFGRDRLFTTHAAPVRDFLQWTSKIGIEPYGVETRLWFRDTPIPAQGTWNMSVVASPETLAEESFMHLGLPVSSYVLDAYVLDALYRKETTIEPVLSRIVPVRGGGSAFCYPVIERAIAASFRYFLEDYNWFADHEAAVLRNRFAVLHEALVRFVLHLQELRFTPEQIPEQGSVVLGQIIAHAVSALETLSLPGDVEGEMESLWASLEGMEDSFFDVKTAIQESLPDMLRDRFSILGDGEESDE